MEHRSGALGESPKVDEDGAGVRIECGEVGLMGKRRRRTHHPQQTQSQEDWAQVSEELPPIFCTIGKA